MKAIDPGYNRLVKRSGPAGLHRGDARSYSSLEIYNRGVFVFSDLIRCGFALMIRLFYAGGDFVRGPSSIAEDFWLPRVQVSLLRHFLDCLLFSRCRQ